MSNDSSCQTVIGCECIICEKTFTSKFETHMCPPCHAKWVASLRELIKRTTPTWEDMNKPISTNPDINDYLSSHTSSIKEDEKQ